MKILAIDTSTDRTAVGIVKDGKLEKELFHQDPLAHGQALAKLISELKSELDNLDLIAVGMGPGPFTGLRSGIAFAQSYALAMNVPWVGVASLDAIAKQFAEKEFIVQVDARRKEVFYARYIGGKLVGEPAVCLPAQLINFNIPIHTGFPNPIHIAELALTQNISEPIYIRRPDAFAAPKGVKFRPIEQPDLVEIAGIEKDSFPIDPWSIEQIKSEYGAPGRPYVVAEFENSKAYNPGFSISPIPYLTKVNDPEVFSKIFAQSKNVFSWKELNDEYWIAHDKEPFAEAWHNPS